MTALELEATAKWPQWVDNGQCKLVPDDNYLLEPRAMSTILYDWIGGAFAFFILLGMIGAVVRASLQDRNLLDKENVKIVTWAVVFGLGSPLLYLWGAPIQMTLSDAYLLRVTTAGWTYVLMGYAAIAGLFVGGLVAVVIRLTTK